MCVLRTYNLFSYLLKTFKSHVYTKHIQRYNERNFGVGNKVKNLQLLFSPRFWIYLQRKYIDLLQRKVFALICSN